MGREIRRVPENWEHPKNNSEHYYGVHSDDRYRPLYDKDYDSAAEEWLAQLKLWLGGDHKYQHEGYFWDYEGLPPDREYYRNKEYGTDFKGEPTHYQIYETVSEGTPVSPKFPNLEELVKWLVKQGYSEISAREFAKIGSAPSMVVSGDRVYKDIESLSL